MTQMSRVSAVPGNHSEHGIPRVPDPGWALLRVCARFPSLASCARPGHVLGSCLCSFLRGLPPVLQPCRCDVCSRADVSGFWSSL